MKYYYKEEIYKPYDTVIVNGVRYFNCTDNWFKKYGAIDVITIEGDGISGLYVIDEDNNPIELYTNQTIEHTDVYYDEIGEEHEYIWHEPVKYKYFEYVGKPIEPKPYEPPVEEQIAQLKYELSTYDYIGVKIAMGVATIDEYKDKIAYTEELRKKINELEDKV